MKNGSERAIEPCARAQSCLWPGHRAAGAPKGPAGGAQLSLEQEELSRSRVESPSAKIPSSTANTRPAFICHLQIYPKVFQELSPLCLFASTSSRDIVPRFVFTVTPFCFRWRITQSRAFPCCMGPGLCLTSFAPPWRESVSSDEPFLVQCHHFFPGFSWRK